MKTIVIIALLFFVLSGTSLAQVKDTVVTVVCGKSEQPTPCLLVLDRTVPSYTITIKLAGSSTELMTFKIERVEGAWQILGETRKEQIIEAVVGTNGSITVVNPRIPNRDIVPNNCDGLIIKAVETNA